MPRVLPDEQPADMRNHKPHPSDHAADGDAGRSRKRRADDDSQPQKLCVDAHAARLSFADSQQIQPPAQKKKRKQAQQNGNHRKVQIVQTNSGQRAHQPIGDGRQLFVRVGNQFNKGGSGGKQRADHHARQHHRQIRAHTAQPPDKIRQSHSRKTEEERPRRNHSVACAKQNCQGYEDVHFLG